METRGAVAHPKGELLPIPHLSTRTIRKPRTLCEVSHCGDEGNRTPNPRLAKAVLCQLSYVP